MRFRYQQIFIFIVFFLKYEDNFRESFAICLSVSPNKTRDETAKRKKRGTVVFFCRGWGDGRSTLDNGAVPVAGGGEVETTVDGPTTGARREEGDHYEKRRPSLAFYVSPFHRVFC